LRFDLREISNGIAIYLGILAGRWLVRWPSGEVPGVVSQGETLDELEENIRDAYFLMMKANSEDVPADALSKPLVLAS
jgi:predicted RNase H-like HicB family nuclease